MSTRDRGNNGQSIAAASRWESNKRPGMGGRRETWTARVTGGGGGRWRQALQLPGERMGVRTADGKADNPASADSRRLASGQAATLGGDKRGTTARPDGRVVSLFRWQLDGTVGKTVRQ